MKFGNKIKILFIFNLILLCSCVPKTEPFDPLTKSEYSKLKNVAVFTSVDEEFTVMIERAKQSHYWTSGCYSTECIIGELIAYIIIESVDSYLDQKSDLKDAEKIQKKLEQFNPEEQFSIKLIENIKSNNPHFNVEIVDSNSPGTLKEKGFDTILEVNLIDWGLELCPKNRYDPEFSEYFKLLDEWNKYSSKYGGAKDMLFAEQSLHISKEDQEEMDRLRPLVNRYTADEKVKSQIKASAKIIDLNSNDIVWMRTEIYKDKKCEWLSDINDNPAILYGILSNAINNLAINTVNEIEYLN